MKRLFFLFIITSCLSNNLKAQDPILKLKNGALLVRLQTNQNLINYYISIGNLHESQKIIDKQNRKNENIIESFKEKWTICPVYFFYSNYSNEIINNQFDNVFTIDKTPIDKHEQKKIQNNFLIASIGKKDGTVKFHALILSHQNLRPLKKPCPRYVRTYKGLWIFKRKLTNSIQILEKKIIFYLSRI